MEKPTNSQVKEYLYTEIPGTKRVVSATEVFYQNGWDKDAGEPTGLYDRQTTLLGEVLTPVVSAFIKDNNGNLVPNPKVGQPVKTTVADAYLGVQLKRELNPNFVKVSDK
jgi:hypothetical protein